MRKDIIDYVEKELQKDRSLASIKKALYSVGHPKQTVEEVEQHIKSKRKYKIMKIGFSIAGLLVLLVFGLLFIIGERESMTDQDYYQKALETKNTSFCVNIINDSLQERCQNVDKLRIPNLTEEQKRNQELYHEARESDNAALCEEITNQVIKESCLRATE